MSFDLIAAPFTPFAADGRLNLDAIPAYASFLRRNGVHGVFVCGTTGEATSLSLDERLRVTESWAKACDDRFRLIVHVGDTCLESARRMAAHARDHGAHGIAAVAPFYLKPRTADDLVRWCAKIAEGGAPLPFYYYHIPEFTGVAIPASDFFAAAQGRIPTLAGVKFSGADLADFAECRKQAGPASRLFFGKDEWLIEGLRHGAAGAVGTTYNYAAPLYQGLIAAFEAGDEKEAARRQEVAVRMIEICAGTGVSHLAAAKELMSRMGIPCGPVREPLSGFPGEKIDGLLSSLREIGFDEFRCR